MIAKYHSTCRGCGDDICVNDEITWTQAGGPRCLACGPVPPDEPRGAATASEDEPGYVRTLRQSVKDLEDKLNAQYRDICYLQAWARQVSEDLGVAPPMKDTDV